MSNATTGGGGGGSGTVTSVAASVPSVLSVSGSPITTTGTLAISYSGTALPVANGGTGATTLTANNVLLGNGTSAVQLVAPGSSGNILVSNGTTWTSAANSAFTAYTCRYYGMTTNWTTSEATFNFPTSGWDPNSMVTTGASWKCTIPADGAGKYLVLTRFTFNAAAWDGATRTCTVYVYNSSDVEQSHFTSEDYFTTVRFGGGAATNSSPYARFLGVAVVSCAATDYIRIKGNNDSNGGTKSLLTGDADYNHVTIVRLTN